MTKFITTENEIEIPDPLVTTEDDVVSSANDWREKQRSKIMDLFKTRVYGQVPDADFELETEIRDYSPAALEGQAIRKQTAITVTHETNSLNIDLLEYLPVSAVKEPVPVFVLLNFGGNQTVNHDSAIYLPRSYIREKFSPPEEFRGSKQSRFPVEEIIRRGYGIVTAYYGDIDPDFDDGFKNGVHGLLETPGNRSPHSWGAVSAWAWGLSRIVDYIQKNDHIDRHRIASVGHSRLGKTSLWAGAQDERISLVFSNNSGCTGAALARRKKGETIKAINEKFPHWFCENYTNYNEREETLPVDQHMLISLIAPRPVYVASAVEDEWSDPEGEFLSCVYAQPVYNLFGREGLETEKMPPLNSPINHGQIGYHIRSGKHDLTEYDWRCFMDFADRHWRDKA